MSIFQNLLRLQSGQLCFRHNQTLNILGSRDIKPPFDGKMYLNENLAYRPVVHTQLAGTIITIDQLKGYIIDENLNYRVTIHTQLSGEGL